MIDVSTPSCPQDEASTNEMKGFFVSGSVQQPNNANWQYFLGLNMQEIIPGVFLGPYSSAQKHCLKNLLDNGIRYIVCVRRDTKEEFISPINDPSITYLTLDIADNVTENIIRFFPKVRQFIDEALAKNFKVLVHGNSGNSRSATLVLAYVMEKYGLSSNEAYQFVKEKRASISPNEGFVAQLTEYEPIYKARQTLSNGEPSRDNNCRQKRKSEQLCEMVDYDLIQHPPSPNIDNNNEVAYQSSTELSNHLYSLLVIKK